MEVAVSRAQLALNVDNLDEAITFYSKLFDTPPAKVKPGYANFAVAEPPLKLVLIENPGHGGTLNHLGVEVGSSDAVHAEIARLTNEGMFTEEELRHHLLLRHPGQGVGDRTRRGEVGGLHRARRLGHVRHRPEGLASGGCSCDSCDSRDESTARSATCC